MFKDQKFKSKPCKQCQKEYQPRSSVQKVCESCRAEYRYAYRKAWRKNNLEHDNQVRREYYWNNLAKVRQWKRNWNRTKGVEYRKKYYANKKSEVYQRLKENYGHWSTGRTQANRLIKKLGWERICSQCDSLQKVEIHHLDGNELNNDISNLLLLCRQHHLDWHIQHRLANDVRPS